MLTGSLGGDGEGVVVRDSAYHFKVFKKRDGGLGFFFFFLLQCCCCFSPSSSSLVIVFVFCCSSFSSLFLYDPFSPLDFIFDDNSYNFKENVIESQPETVFQNLKTSLYLSRSTGNITHNLSYHLADLRHNNNLLPSSFLPLPSRWKIGNVFRKNSSWFRGDKYKGFYLVFI